MKRKRSKERSQAQSACIRYILLEQDFFTTLALNMQEIKLTTRFVYHKLVSGIAAQTKIFKNSLLGETLDYVKYTGIFEKVCNKLRAKQINE